MPEIGRLAGPVVLAMLTQTAVNLADTIMVGLLETNLSITGQSAIGYSMIVLWSIGGFLSALGIGTQAMVARRYGSGDDRGAGGVLTNAAVVSAIAAGIFTVAVWEPLDEIYRFLSPSEDVVQVGSSYCRWRIVGLVPMVMTATYKGFFDGLSHTRVHMFAAIVMNVSNILFNYLLIFGVGPFERYGVDGAGMASSASSFIGFAIMVAWAMRQPYRTRHPYLRPKALSWRSCWELLRLSVPTGMASVVMMAGFALFLKVMGMLDARAVSEAMEAAGAGVGAASGDLYAAALQARPPIYTAATKVVMDLMSIVFMSAVALGTATATLVSQSMGAQKFDLAARYGWASYRMAAWVTAAFGVLTFAMPETFLALFSKDAAVVAAGVDTVRLMSVVNVAIAVGLTAAYALFGAGNSRYVMTVQATLHFVLLVPLAWFLGVYLDLGMVGAFGSIGAYAVLLMIFMLARFKSGRWKTIQI